MGKNSRSHIVEAIDYRTGPYYNIHHIVRTLWRPIIGMAGMDLYGFYVQTALPQPDGTRRARIHSEIILAELEISAATLSDFNFVLEWCHLIKITNRDKREVNQVYLLNPKHLVKEVDPDLRYMGYVVPPENQMTLDDLKTRIKKGTAPRKTKGGKPTKGKYRLRSTLYRRIDNWLPPDERRQQIIDTITIVHPVIPKKLKELQSELPLDGHTNGQGANGTEKDLLKELTAAYGGDKQAEQTASRTLKKHGPARCELGLELWPLWVEYFDAIGGCKNPAGVLTELIDPKGKFEGEPPEPQTKGGFSSELTEASLAAQEQREAAKAERLAQLVKNGVTEEDVKLWDEVLSRAQRQMTQATFDTWLRDSGPIRREDDKIVIEVVNSYAKDWCENRIRETLERNASSVGLTSTIVFEARPEVERAL